MTDSILTLENLQKYATENNIGFEAYSNYFDRWGHRVPGVTNIGLEFKKDVYYWWEHLPKINPDHLSPRDYIYESKPFIFFTHRYNRNNGAVIKSLRKGFAAERIILNN